MFHLVFALSESNRRPARILAASTFARDSAGKSPGYSIATPHSWCFCAAGGPSQMPHDVFTGFMGGGILTRRRCGGFVAGKFFGGRAARRAETLPPQFAPQLPALSHLEEDSASVSDRGRGN